MAFPWNEKNLKLNLKDCIFRSYNLLVETTLKLDTHNRNVVKVITYVAHSHDLTNAHVTHVSTYTELESTRAKQKMTKKRPMWPEMSNSPVTEQELPDINQKYVVNGYKVTLGVSINLLLRILQWLIKLKPLFIEHSDKGVLISIRANLKKCSRFLLGYF